MEKKRGRPRKVSPADREMLIGQFQDACLPVFLVDRKLEVLYTNRYAQESFLAMGLPNGLLAVLNATNEDYASLAANINNCTGAAQRMAAVLEARSK